MLVYYLWWRNPLDDCKMWVYMSEIAIYDEFYENFYTEKVFYEDTNGKNNEKNQILSHKRMI